MALFKKLIQDCKFIFLFTCIFGLILGYCFFAITGRIPAGHDGFLDISIKYYFANSAVGTGSFPQWFPFVGNGTLGACFFPTQCGFMQCLLPWLGGFFKGVGYLKIYYMDYLLKEIIFVLGAWLWCRVFITRTLAKIFFVLTLDASFCWITQPHFNCNLVYALPLIFYLGHSYLSSGRVIFLLILGEMLFLSSITAPIYFLPLVTFVIFIYFLTYVLFRRPNFSTCILSVRNHPLLHLGAILVILATFVLIFIFSKQSMADMVFYQPGRLADGSSRISDFLQYGHNISFNKWIECFFPFSPELDYSLYSGCLVPFFLICGVLSFNNKRIWLLLLILLLGDFTNGGITAKLAYYIWPLMKYYRHLALSSPIIKLFLGVLAAIGFEFMIDKFLNGKKGAHRPLALGLLFWGLSLGCFFTTLNVPAVLDISHWMVTQTLAVRNFSALWVPTVDYKSAFYAFLLLLTAGLAFLIFLTKDQKVLKIWLSVLVAIIFVDIAFYKVTESFVRTTGLSDSQLKMLNFTPITYPERRTENLGSFERSAIFRSIPLRSVMYEESVLLAFADEPAATFRLTMWLRARDEYWRLFWGQDPFDSSKHPFGLNEYVNVDFPSKSDVASKLSGVTKDKIQFFSKVLYADPHGIAAGMMSKQYVGDVPLVQTGGSHHFDASLLNYNAREDIPYSVKEFYSDKIVIDVNVPQENIYLYYSDTWNKGWKADINNHSIGIFRSNLANKLVALEKGSNRVTMVFNDPFVRFFYLFVQMHFILALIWLPVFLFRELKYGSVFQQPEIKM